MGLPELMAAPPLVDRFTRRFLRETMMFPFDRGEGRFGLAVADPTDIAAQRGAQIVLGGPIMERIAEFYEAKLRRNLDRAIGIVGPFAIIVISVIVGGLIVSVMTALLSVNQVVG